MLTPGQRVRHWREAKKVAQSALAEKTKMEPSKLCRIESGEIEARATDIETLAGALGLTMPEFYGRIPKVAKAS
jgi:transcriptional regulator with XRE-family HTH domain